MSVIYTRGKFPPYLKFLQAYVPAAETYNSYSAHGITIIITVTQFPSDHFPPITTIHSISRFYLHIIHILVYNLFPFFPGLPLCLAISIDRMIKNILCSPALLFRDINISVYGKKPPPLKQNPS